MKKHDPCDCAFQLQHINISMQFLELIFISITGLLPDLLFPVFRFGWKMSLYAIQPSSRNLKLQTFMVVAERDSSTAVSDISLLMDKSVGSHGKQVEALPSYLLSLCFPSKE